MAREILAFVADLMFQTRIEAAAEKLALKVRLVESEDQMISEVGEITAELKIDCALVDTIKMVGPKIIIFDLGNRRTPWADWIKMIKETTEINHIPVICFGSHIDVDAFKEARRVGADEVLARSRFVSNLPNILKKHVGSLSDI